MEDQGMEQGGVSPQEIVKNVSETIMSLAKAASGPRPDVAQALDGIAKEFMNIMGEFVGGASQGGARPVQEQGQGAPVGPQGVM